jgi:hypothetical protein
MIAREIIYTPYFYLQKRNHVGSINEFSSNTRLSLIKITVAALFCFFVLSAFNCKRFSSISASVVVATL